MQKSIFITGCTQGIGLAIAEHFAHAGYNVAGNARNANTLATMANDFSKRYPSSSFYFAACDMRHADAITRFAKQAIHTCGVPDILVNNAGVYKPGNIDTEPDGQFELVMETNVHSAYHMTRAVLPEMKQRGTGHIFNICSIASLSAYAGGGSYSISKFALLGFSKQLRMELIPHGIKVTAIMPGAVLTPSWDGVDLPENRFIPAQDIAKMIEELTKLSPHTNVDELLIRPFAGDI